MPEIDQFQIRRFEQSEDIDPAGGVVVTVGEAAAVAADPSRFSVLTTRNDLIHAGA